jgi:hypothetical protein
VRDRIVGLVLFLPVPLVLWLFTRMPLGPFSSLTLGLFLVTTHSLYARAFALSRASLRCLWCGGPARLGREIQIAEPPGLTRWRACRDEHLSPLTRTLAFTGRHASFLRVGILGSLGVFLVASFLAAGGLVARPILGDARAALRLGVAATVLPLGWAGPREREPGSGPWVVPFPVHIQALVGTCTVVWLFRLVGIAWLVLGVSHVAARAGWSG